jgi:predicted metal-dependent HD superfamily phosphohydrolase
MRFVGDSAVAMAWFDSVLGRHRQLDRHYHDVRHVTWVVHHVVAMASHHPVTDIGAVIAAGFFHDAIYDPRRSDNEQQSAALAERALTEIGWESRRCQAVAAMVLATAEHEVAGVDLDTQVLLAADLGVLAADPANYSDYVRAVRKEYAHVDDDGWRSGRAAVLHRLLRRESLFAPGLELTTWERRARANITAELATLE